MRRLRLGSKLGQLLLFMLIVGVLVLARDFWSASRERLSATTSQGSESTNYRLVVDVFNAGGTSSTSGNYGLSDGIGEAVAGGEASSDNFKLSSGSVPALYGGSGNGPIVTPTPTRTATPDGPTATPTPTPDGPTPTPTITPTPDGDVVISDVRITNVRNGSFTVSWFTNVAASGEVRYGSDAVNLNDTALDVRGGGTLDESHYVTVEGLDPNREYYFDVVSGSTTDNNEDAHYRVTTGPTLGVPTSDTIYGQVKGSDGASPAEGAIVIITLQDDNQVGSPDSAALLSALVDDTGFFYTNLGNARTQDLSNYFSYSASDDKLLLEAQETVELCQSSIVSTANDTPVETMELSPCVDISPIHLQIGWNHIALPLEPTVAYTAESVCDLIDEQGGQAVEIDRWLTGGWDGHICGLPFNDFELVLGSDYFIKSDGDSTWTVQGTQVTSPVPLTLQTGWNSIGVPHTDAYTAESLCNEIIQQSVTAVEIDRWYVGGWDGHICGLPFNNFQIQRGVGYFVKTTSSGTVTPDQPSQFRQRDPEVTISPDQIPSGKALPVHNLRISNLRDTAVTLSWTTDEPTTGYVRLAEGNREGLPLQEGEEKSERVAYDTRGAMISSTTHYVVLDNLTPETDYQIELISGRGNALRLPSVTTLPILERIPESHTIYGQVFYADGVTPAAGTIVYLTLENEASPSELGGIEGGLASLLSAIVGADGYWHANLGNAPQPDADSADDRVTLVAHKGAESITLTADIGALQPAPPLILNQQTQQLYLPLITSD